MTKAKQFVVCAAAAAAGVSVYAPQASAAFVLIEDFQGRTPGALNGQNGFTATAGSQVVTDPGNASNQLLRTNANDSTVAKAISIPDNTTATLYFQIKTGAQINASLGASDLAAPANFDSFEPQLNINALNNVQPIRVRDAAAFDALSDQGGSASTITAGQAIGVYMVIDNTTDTTRVYLQEAGDAAPVLQLNGVQADFAFRTPDAGAVGDLLSFYLRTGGAANATDAAGSGALFVDNIYLDTSGSNLTAPAPLISGVVPEPASFGVLGLAGVALAARRRRR